MFDAFVTIFVSIMSATASTMMYAQITEISYYLLHLLSIYEHLH